MVVKYKWCVCVCIQELSQPGLGILSDFTLKKKKEDCYLSGGNLIPYSIIWILLPQIGVALSSDRQSDVRSS